MNDNIFRKSSLDKIRSPEQLDDYIKVSSPSAFVIIIAAALLLASLLVWGIFGTVTVSGEVMRPIDFILGGIPLKR
ncbi:MAG: hypothetical protein LBN97_02060 [Oscillospiraceae bacterium]|jgi:hypothetical protein|nr:hypothetical protein [Oscillospiraceae bacterium]